MVSHTTRTSFCKSRSSLRLDPLEGHRAFLPAHGPVESGPEHVFCASLDPFPLAFTRCRVLSVLFLYLDIFYCAKI